ncbi:MAG: NADPH-dependent F420 reductase [Paracoccaceae bacterium]
MMEIGIIGAGMIGGTLARLLAARGHAVCVGTRNAQDPRVAELPAGVERATVEEAAEFGTATIVAVPFAGWPDLAQVLRPLTGGRAILDTSNAIPGRDGAAAMQALASGEGSGVAVAALLPKARVVKAFNTVHFAALADRAGKTPPLGIPLAGDDPAAVAIAASVVAAAGFAPVPAGALSAAARFDFGTPLFNVALSEADLRRALSPLA